MCLSAVCHDLTAVCVRLTECDGLCATCDDAVYNGSNEICDGLSAVYNGSNAVCDSLSAIRYIFEWSMRCV